jgi:hypothetical protein
MQLRLRFEEEDMIRNHRGRARLGIIWCALALAALALLALPGLAAARDGNHDRIPDRWEKRHELSLKVNQARRDQDGDHLRNRAEFLAGDNPRDRDSDDDGVVDGHEQAGTIASFDAATGRLVIDLFGAGTVSGLVNDQTEIECEDHLGATVSSEGPGSGSGEAEPGDDGVEVGDDHGGQGEEEPGDDHGDDDAGDDRHGDNSGPGSANSGPGHGEENDDDEDRACTVAELVPGAAVEEAELRIAAGQAVFEEIELSGRDA